VKDLLSVLRIALPSVAAAAEGNRKAGVRGSNAYAVITAQKGDFVWRK
jgi:hypothetical protein